MLSRGLDEADAGHGSLPRQDIAFADTQLDAAEMPQQAPGTKQQGHEMHEQTAPDSKQQHLEDKEKQTAACTTPHRPDMKRQTTAYAAEPAQTQQRHSTPCSKPPMLGNQGNAAACPKTHGPDNEEQAAAHTQPQQQDKKEQTAACTTPDEQHKQQQSAPSSLLMDEPEFTQEEDEEEEPTTDAEPPLLANVVDVGSKPQLASPMPEHLPSPPPTVTKAEPTPSPKRPRVAEETGMDSLIPHLSDTSASKPRPGEPTLSPGAIKQRARRIFTPRANGTLKVSQTVFNEWQKKNSKERKTLECIFQSCGYDPDGVLLNMLRF